MRARAVISAAAAALRRVDTRGVWSRVAIGCALVLVGCDDGVLVSVRATSELANNTDVFYGSSHSWATLTNLDGTSVSIAIGTGTAGAWNAVDEGGSADLHSSGSDSPTAQVETEVSVAGLRAGDVIWFLGNTSEPVDVPADCTCVGIADPIWTGGVLHWTQVGAAVPTIRYFSTHEGGPIGPQAYRTFIDGETGADWQARGLGGSVNVVVLSCSDHSYDDLRARAALMFPQCP